MAKKELTLPDSGTTSNGRAPLSFADIKALKQAKTLEVEMVLDISRRGTVADAEKVLRTARLAQAMLGDDSTKAEKAKATRALKAAEEDLEAAKSALAEATITWKLKAIGYKEIDELYEAWPASAQQQLEHRKQLRDVGETASRLRYNPAEFEPRLVAACVVEPELTEEEALEMWQSDDWSEGELALLFQSAITLCQVPQ